MVTPVQDPLPLKTSQHVRVVQGIAAREGSWETQVEGRVLSFSREPTGSWFAHGKDGRLWLRRLRIQKEDGEIVDLILNSESSVTVLRDHTPSA